MRIPKIKINLKHKKAGRPKGSKNLPKVEQVESKPKLPKELSELMTKKIELISDSLVDELNKQNLLINTSLDYRYLMKLVRLVDCNRDLEINITTKDGCNISIRNNPEDYTKQDYESLMESLPVDERNNIRIS